jgi:TatD DNase family protein
MIFDSHAHYDDNAFNEDRVEVIEKVKEAKVTKIINCGADMNTCLSTIELVNNYDMFYGAIGIHPQSAGEALQNLNKIGDMLSSKKIVGVGEIGLDYYWEGYDRETQIKAFKEQMDIARSLNLPVIIHDRDAHEDSLKVIKEFKGVRGVFHCYSGSTEFAKELLKMDYYLGFTGVITFKNAKKAIEVVEYMPFDRLLVETDCPYMAPVPHRGKRCDSSYLTYTLEKIAEIKGVDYETACKTTYDNTCNLFSIDI